VLSHRFLKYINIAIALVLVAVAVAGYWLLYRPLPKTSGTIHAPIEQQVRIARDPLGVPHITAATIEDALFAQGFVTAQDRLWQMDMVRRLAAGELSEILGAAGLELDRQARALRLQELASRHAASMPPGDRAHLAAYARGVNHFITINRGRSPIEFRLLGYDPRLWKASDTMLIAMQMFRTLTSTYEFEIEKSAMLAAGGEPEKVNALYPPRNSREVQPGSNAWAISGQHTASGKPILANDPHLEHSLPSIWYLTHLKAPGLNVTGAALVGVPGILIGHNERIAWGCTNLQFDVMDLYTETFDAPTGRYRYGDAVEQAVLERDAIRVRGGRPVEASTWVTRHGPVVSSQAGRLLSLRWTAAEAATASFPIVELNRARDWRSFRAALARYAGPAQNFIYADVDGNIGHQAAGKLPVRRGHLGDVPANGAGGKQEWEGFIPFEELPFTYNPPSGMLISANQDPFPSTYSQPVAGYFGAPYRAEQIRHLLSARRKWTAEEMLAIQKDVYSAFLHLLARQVVAAYDKRGMKSASQAAAVEGLRNWDGQMVDDSAAAFTATLVFQHLRRAVAERAAPGQEAVYDSYQAPEVLENLLRSRPRDWFEDWDQLLLRCLIDAVEEGQRMQGRDASKWRYGTYNRVALAHPIAGGVKWVGQYFNIGLVELSGSATTVRQTTRRLGVTMRMVADLGNWDRSLQNVATGQSGHVLSSHYKDQWKRHRLGQSFRMQFNQVEEDDVLVLTPGK
jgi:penicillin amidase